MINVWASSHIHQHSLGLLKKRREKKQMQYKKKGSQSAGGIKGPFHPNFPCPGSKRESALAMQKPNVSEVTGPCEASCCSQSRLSPAQDVTPSSGILCNTLPLNQAINNAKSSRITGSGWKHWLDTNKHTRTTRSTYTHILFPHRCQLHHLSVAPSNRVRKHKIVKLHLHRRRNIYIFIHTSGYCAAD